MKLVLILCLLAFIACSSEPQATMEFRDPPAHEVIPQPEIQDDWSKPAEKVLKKNKKKRDKRYVSP